MAYQKQTYQDGVTEYTDTMFEHMDDGIFGAYPVQLIAISDTAPSECVENDKYYNTSTKKIYTATGTNTWGTNGETPLEDTSYWLISENGNYAWDGTDLVSIGGGKAEVIISDEEPEDGKLWVDTAEIPVIAGREHLIQVSNEVDEDYRVSFIKGKNLYNLETDIANTVIGSDGALVSATGYTCSQLIPVEPSSQYTVSYVNTSSSENIIRIGFYKSDGTPISRTTISTNYTITTPANCYYIRVAYLTQTNHSVQVEEGSTATIYEPYTRSIYVDNEEIYSKPVVLWTNPSPTSSFASQTINLNEDASNYNFLEIYCKNRNDVNELMSCKIPVGTSGFDFMISPAGTSFRVFARLFNNTTTDKVVIGDCIFAYDLNSDTTTNNNYAIPIQVLGYK